MKSVTQKNIKIFRRNWGICFDKISVFCGTYFCDWLIETVFCLSNFYDLGPKLLKISSAIIYSATIYDR